MRLSEKYRESGVMHYDSLKDVDEQELLELKLLVDGDLASITAQLTDAKQKAAAEGDYSDSAWFTSAIKAKLHKGRLSQQIQFVLGQLRNERKRLNREESRRDREALLWKAIKELPKRYQEQVRTRFSELQAAEGGL